MRVGWRAALPAALAGLLFVAGPMACVALREPQGPSFGALMAVDGLLIFTLALTLLLAASRLPCSTWLAGAVSLTAAGYYGALWALVLYWQVTGHRFDILFALDADRGDVWGTLVRTLGRWLPVVGVGLLAAFASFLAIFWAVFRALRRARPYGLSSGWILVPIGLLSCGLWLSDGEQRLVLEEVRNAGRALQGRSAIAPIFPDDTGFATDSRESLFILQLESGNALALSGDLTLDGRRYTGDYMPQTRRIARDGVFFPYFWSNSIQSNRALVNILCGVTNNVSRALSYTPDKIRSDCLPRLLARSGYRTAFFGGFSDFEFMNYEGLLPALGFQEVWDSRIVGRVETDDAWGVDDCQFHRAMFDVLRGRGSSERLFVYATVSSHHFPFSGRAQYAGVHPFRQPESFVERYLNSYAEQDHCLAVFHDEFRDFAGDHTHLIIVPDHSWPVGIHGNTLNEARSFDENFLVPFVYVPPRSRSGEFRVGERVALRPAHTDILPTVFELLNGRPYPNSFAFALRRGAAPSDAYESCQVLVQPYSGGEIAIVNGRRKHVYHVSSRRLLRYDVDNDPREERPEVLAEDIPYWRVREGYYCRRYAR